MGRKRWGEAPSNAIAMRAKGLKAFEKTVFGPCTLMRTWGTRQEELENVLITGGEME
jgi:hypothetical protein